MQNISIDFVSQNDVQISIDGEKLKDIAGFYLKIKENEIPIYSIEKKVFQEQKEQKKALKEIKNSPRLRTINQAAKELKEKDANTVITESIIRKLIREEKIGYIQDGNKKLVDLNDIEKYYESNKTTIKNVACPKMKAIY